MESVAKRNEWQPVILSLCGLIMSSTVNMYNICAHQDPAFEVLTEGSIRLLLILTVLSPCVMIGFIGMFYFTVIIGLVSPTDAPQLVSDVLVCTPILPFLLSFFSLIRICTLIYSYRREASGNQDEEALLTEPKFPGSEVLDKHLKHIFWSCCCCMILLILSLMPSLSRILQIIVKN